MPRGSKMPSAVQEQKSLQQIKPNFTCAVRISADPWFLYVLQEGEGFQREKEKLLSK